MDFSIFADPVKIGPGIWFDLHVEAVHATTDPLKEAFIVNTNAKCDNFKCKKCQPHFRKFIDTHNWKDYWNILDVKGRDIGFFKWTWELHNQVNKFLGKYQPTLEEAYEFFANAEAGACFNCGGAPAGTTGPTGPSAPKPPDTIPEQRSRAIPEILTRYNGGQVAAQPFKLISREQ
jgi:hypothetical protein